MPLDVVALRTSDPQQALAWRTRVGEVLVAAFEQGYRAGDMSRSGWYRLVQDEQDEQDEQGPSDRRDHR